MSSRGHKLVFYIFVNIFIFFRMFYIIVYLLTSVLGGCKNKSTVLNGINNLFGLHMSIKITIENTNYNTISINNLISDAYSYRWDESPNMTDFSRTRSYNGWMVGLLYHWLIHRFCCWALNINFVFSGGKEYDCTFMIGFLWLG